jgi:hypothetical protein
MTIVINPPLQFDRTPGGQYLHYYFQCWVAPFAGAWIETRSNRMRKKSFLGIMFLPLVLCLTGCVQPEGKEPEPDEWIEVAAYDELTGTWRAVNRVTVETGEDWGQPPAELSFEYAVELIYPAGDGGGKIESRIIIDFEEFADFRAERYISFLYSQGLPQGISGELFKESLWEGLREQESGDGTVFEGYKRIEKFFAAVPPGGSYENEDEENPLLINTGGTKLKQTRPVSIDIDGENLFTGEGEFVFSLLTP